MNEFDQHAIVIRKRSNAELIDLALKWARQEFAVLVGLFLPAALFFFVVNRLLLGSPLDWVTLEDESEIPALMIYAWLMLILICVETPFVSSAMRCWLGMRTFRRYRRPRAGEALLVWFHAIPQLVVFHLLLAPISIFYEFLPEVILLERTPFFRGKGRPSSTWRRARQLHKGTFGESLSFGFMFCCGACCVVVGLCSVLYMLLETTIGPVGDDRIEAAAFYLQFMLVPILWFVMWFAAILQFLRYINLRIIKEGWDVDLEFRAERRRMNLAGSFQGGLLLLCLLFLVSGNAAAAENATHSPAVPVAEANDDRAVRTAAESLGRRRLTEKFPWYSRKTDDIRAVPFPKERSHHSSRSSRTSSVDYSWMKALGYPLLFLLAVLLLLGLYFAARAALIYCYGKDFLSPEARREAEERARRIETLPPEAQAEYHNLLAAAMRAHAAADWRGALILYFSYMLIELDRAGHIRLLRGKTNHEYAWELRNAAQLQWCYRATMTLFEKVYFGEYPIDEAIFETVWQDRERFHRLLRGEEA